MNKNYPSTYKLSLYLTILLSIFQIIFWISFHSILSLLIEGILFFLICWVIIYQFIHQFIQKKIHVIYKLIYKTKTSYQEDSFYKFIIPHKDIQDINKEVERWAVQFQQEQELYKQSELYRKEFLQNLSHELKNPLFILQGCLECIETEQTNKNREPLPFLQDAMNQTHRLVHLVEDMSTISRLEEGSEALHCTIFHVDTLLEQVQTQLHIPMNKKQISATWKESSIKNISVYADKNKIQQVFTNIFDNAIKYNRTNGNINIAIYPLHENKILIEISDNGIGIPQSDIPRVFERFYRVTDARNYWKEGSGLGLSICKHIIEAHHQTIHIRSKINIGTTIGITLNKFNDA